MMLRLSRRIAYLCQLGGLRSLQEVLDIASGLATVKVLVPMLAGLPCGIAAQPGMGTNVEIRSTVSVSPAPGRISYDNSMLGTLDSLFRAFKGSADTVPAALVKYAETAYLDLAEVISKHSQDEQTLVAEANRVLYDKEPLEDTVSDADWVVLGGSRQGWYDVSDDPKDKLQYFKRATSKYPDTEISHSSFDQSWHGVGMAPGVGDPQEIVNPMWLFAIPTALRLHGRVDDRFVGSLTFPDAAVQRAATFHAPLASADKFTRASADDAAVSSAAEITAALAAALALATASDTPPVVAPQRRPVPAAVFKDHTATTTVLVGALYNCLGSFRELVAASICAGGREAKFVEGAIHIPDWPIKKTTAAEGGDGSKLRKGPGKSAVGKHAGQSTAGPPAATGAAAAAAAGGVSGQQGGVGTAAEQLAYNSELPIADKQERVVVLTSRFAQLVQDAEALQHPDEAVAAAISVAKDALQQWQALAPNTATLFAEIKAGLGKWITDPETLESMAKQLLQQKLKELEGA